MATIKTVGIVGAGTMGNGIAQVFAQAGFAVRVHDVASAALDRARQTIERSLAKFVDKGKLQAADRDAALGRLTMSANLDSLCDADYLVEAVAAAGRVHVAAGSRAGHALHEPGAADDAG